MSNTNYNIAIIGQTGVGKSSLINYLFGGEIVKAGIGRPVTTNGFHKINHKIKDMSVNIYDSWGLEVGKEEKWLEELNTELKIRGIDKPASDWFHSIFYCISAAGGRIQDADSKIVKKLINENYKVSIVLTKADSLTEEEEAEFIKVIGNEIGNEIAIIPVCSEHKKTRGGEIHPFGKENVEKQSLIDLVDSLILRIPKHSEEIMLKEFNTWKYEQLNKINNDLSIFGFNSSKLQSELSSSSKEIIKKIDSVASHTERTSLEQYSFIFKHLKSQISTKTQNSHEYIKEKETEDLRWYEIALASVILPLVLPFFLPFFRGMDVKEMHQQINEFALNIEKTINQKTKDLKLSLEGIKIKILADLT